VLRALDAASIPYGPPERIAERIERYRVAGIDELVIELRKPDLADQLDDLRRFCKALSSWTRRSSGS
jgi:hypothetical protein